MNLNISKILMITSRSDMGGGPKHVYDLSRQLLIENPNLEIFIAAPESPPFGEKYKEMATNFYPIPSRSFSIKSFFQLLLFIKKNPTCLVHSHGRGAGLYSRLLRLFGANIIHTFHGAHNAPGVIGRLKLFVDQLLAPLTKRFICVSEDEMNKAISLGIASKDKIKIIKNGIDLKTIKEIPPHNLKLKYDIPESAIIWGTLARLSPEKGLDVFLEALSKTSIAEDKFFLIAGDGEQAFKLKEIVKRNNIKNILFTGELQNPIPFLKGLDGYFSFSHGEGLPLSVLEALASGLPCVLSHVPGHDQFIDHASLFNLNAPESFFEKINLPMKSSDENFIKDFSLDKMAKQVLNQYYDSTPNSKE